MHDEVCELVQHLDDALCGIMGVILSCSSCRYMYVVFLVINVVQCVHDCIKHCLACMYDVCGMIHHPDEVGPTALCHQSFLLLKQLPLYIFGVLYY